MPTGYTRQIKDGISFQQFAMSCARAFGACIMMRDDPADKSIPEKFEPSTYNSRELNKAQKELEKINKLSIEEGKREAITEFADEIQRRNRDIEENRKLINQYKDMLQQVEQWQPPTPDHIEFKKFMISQIEGSIKFDGNEDYYIKNPIKKLTGEDWLARKRKDILWNIAYHAKEYNDEIERTNQRNKWVKDLRDSLLIKGEENDT